MSQSKEPEAATSHSDEADLTASLSSLTWLTRLHRQSLPVVSDLVQFPKPDARSCTSTPDDEAALEIDWEQETKRKPPFAYATLIYMALRESDKEKLALGEIYDYIYSNFAYYRQSGLGWKARK